MSTELPPVVDAVLELGIKRLRTAIGDGEAGPYIPRMILLVDHDRGMILQFALVEPQDDYARPAIEALEKSTRTLGGVPREIQVRDVNLATSLQKHLSRFGVSVVVREALPALDQAFAAMGEMRGLMDAPQPGLLDVAGMTLDHVHAFADAARAFYEAKPWDQLLDEDLIHVQSPAGPKGTEFTTVLGAAGQVFGLGFVASRAAHHKMQEGGGLPRGGIWSLQFGDLDQLPFDDGEMWVESGLPLAGADAYPSFLKYTRSKKRPGYPSPDELVWAEGLLRAMAATTEDELDSGRWEKTVETFNGPATYKLSLPILLEQMSGKPAAMGMKEPYAIRSQMEEMLRGLAQRMAEGEEIETGKLIDPKALAPAEPKTDAERAQAMVYRARQSMGRRVLQLARQALAIDPDCVDALVLLAERCADPRKALPLLQRAVAAGEKTLGEEFFKENAGHFWGLIETRPYMRARHQLSRALFATGGSEESAAHLREMLRLNPGDNQGVRYLLAQVLLQTNQLDELDHLLNRMFADEDMAEWAFTRALLEFRRGGDSPESRKRLADAVASNPHVVPLLTGRRAMPPYLAPQYAAGSEEEAALTVNEIGNLWERTPRAMEWLEAAAPQPAGGGKAEKARRKRGK